MKTKNVQFNGCNAVVEIERECNEPAIDCILEHAVEKYQQGTNLDHFQKLGYSPEEIQFVFRDKSWWDKDETFGVDLIMRTTHAETEVKLSNGYSWVYFSKPTANSTRDWWVAWKQTIELRESFRAVLKAQKEQSNLKKLAELYAAGKLFTNDNGIKPVKL